MKPDNPVISIDAASLESLPPEMREVMASLYTEQEKKKAEAKKQEELAYQTEQANTLLACSDKWEEVVIAPTYEQVKAEQINDDIEPDLIPDDEEGYASWEIADCNQYMLQVRAAERDKQIPTVHQFYHDLYDISGGIPYVHEDGKEPRILVNHRDRNHPYQLYTDYWEFIKGVGVETSFLYMGDFWQPDNGEKFLIAKRNAMTHLNGFCVDIDRVEDKEGRHFKAEWVITSLLELLDEHPEVNPNYLMLSGTGIQLWYVFGERIPLLSAKPRNGHKASPRRDKYQDVLKLLYQWFNEHLPSNRFKVDVPCATISHAFRAPASPTKLHYPTRLFVYGGRNRKMISPLDLSDFLNGPLKPFDLEDLTKENYQRIWEEHAQLGGSAPASEKQLAWLEKLQAMGCVEVQQENLTIADADALIKEGEVVFTRRGQYRTTGGSITTTAGHNVARRPRDPKLYKFTLEKMMRDTPTGTRYNALFGLAGLAWNCGIPKDQVERDMMNTLETGWAQDTSRDGKALTKDDVKAAMRGYNKLGALRPRAALEFRLDWKYGPPAKRNGRKQEDHLRRARAVQALDYPDNSWAGRNKGSKDKKPRKHPKAQLIQNYAAEHPNATQREIAAALGVSKTTVNKWMKNNPK